MTCLETDLNKSRTYFCIPFKCNVLCKIVCIMMYIYLNKILFTLRETQNKNGSYPRMQTKRMKLCMLKCMY